MKLFLFLISMLFIGCIPLQIAPNIDGAKLYKPKKFKKQLPYNYVYVFEDPKDANEFFNYMNAKFQIVYDDATGNIPISIKNKTYFITFYEVERNTETINLLPMVVDASLENKGYRPMMENVYTSRTGQWYIALTITDENLQDALKPTYKSHKNVIAYADDMRAEYLNTVHYIEVYLKSKTQ